MLLSGTAVDADAVRQRARAVADGLDLEAARERAQDLKPGFSTGI
jgi:hypothetical protein